MSDKAAIPPQAPKPSFGARTMKWLKQPTTAGGIAALGALSGQLITGSLTWQSAVPLGVVGVLGLIWPNMPTAEKHEIEEIIGESLKVAAEEAVKKD